MPAAPAIARLPAARGMARSFLIGGVALGLLVVVVIGGLAGGLAVTGSSSEPAAVRFGIDWASLAAIGKIECDHGRSQAPGCNPPGTVNSTGATGPMQFLGSSWRSGTPPTTVPSVGPPTASTSAGYATDGDGDGLADVGNPADATAGGARLLRANG